MLLQRSPFNCKNSEIAHLFALLLQRFSFVWQIPLLTWPPFLYPVRTGSSVMRPNIALNFCRFGCPSAFPGAEPSIHNRRIRNSVLSPDYNGARMAFTSGKKLGPYEIVSALDAGGMGELYRAHDTRLGSTVVR